MTPAGEVLAAEIAREGTIGFDRFMEVALYHPEHGYYTSERERFGAGGDFYTAEQVQPAFGILMREMIRRIRLAMGAPPEFTVVELGAGRREMAAAFAQFTYVPVEVGSGTMPGRFTGVVFSNEFFDALPVRVFERRTGEWRELRVAFDGSEFAWELGAPR